MTYTKRYTMRAHALDAWLKALRSGEYTQGTLKLRRTDENGQKSFCCLGVLSDLAVKEGVCKWNDDITHSSVDGVDAFLPDSVISWAGLADMSCQRTRPYDPVVFIHTQCATANLSILNDDGKTFMEIADIIEQNVQPV